MYGFIFGLCSIDLYVCYMQITYCFDYYGFVIQFKIRKCDASSFILLSQLHFGYLGSILVPYEFQDCSISLKNIIGILVGIALNLQIALNCIVQCQNLKQLLKRSSYLSENIGSQPSALGYQPTQTLDRHSLTHGQ